MNAIDVYPIGSQVLVDSVVQARVTAIFIRANRITYEVVWWNERERHEEVVEEWEIQSDSDDARKLRIDPVL